MPASPPLTVDMCGQCVLNVDLPPYCVKDCDGVWRTLGEPAYFLDSCNFCVAPGSNPNAHRDYCGVCDGNNATLNQCGVCNGTLGVDGCGQAASCLNLPCGVDCDGVERNSLIMMVDE